MTLTFPHGGRRPLGLTRGHTRLASGPPPRNGRAGQFRESVRSTFYLSIVRKKEELRVVNKVKFHWLRYRKSCKRYNNVNDGDRSRFYKVVRLHFGNR